ncbi:MAG: hypothetical protein WBQ25_07590 [Nitrososphaeraceae archaeon]
MVASGLLVTTSVVHAQNGITPSVKLNAMLKIDNQMSSPTSGYFRYNIQPPSKFDFSPSNSSLSDIKITSPTQAWLSLHNDGLVILTGQIHVTTENATVSTTRILDIGRNFHVDSIDHNKLTGATTYHIAPGYFGLGKMNWSNVALSVKTFENGTGIFSIKGG